MFVTCLCPIWSGIRLICSLHSSYHSQIQIFDICDIRCSLCLVVFLVALLVFLWPCVYVACHIGNLFLRYLIDSSSFALFSFSTRWSFVRIVFLTCKNVKPRVCCHSHDSNNVTSITDVLAFFILPQNPGFVSEVGDTLNVS